MSSSSPLPPGYRSVQDFLLRCHSRISSTRLDQQQIQNNKSYKVQPCLSCTPETTQSTKPNRNDRFYYEGSYKNASLPSELPKPDSISFHPI